MANTRYEERYCAFADILGFSDLVENLPGTTNEFAVVRDLLRSIHEVGNLGERTAKQVDLRAQSISDAVAVSTSNTPRGLSVLFQALTNLALRLLRQGYFTRGAICKGLLYHDDTMVFGKAFLRAYRFESQIARFPRILITRQVKGDAAKALGKDRPTFLRQAEDGPFYLHVLRRLEVTSDVIRTDSSLVPSVQMNLPYYADCAKQIQKRFDESVDNPSHFEKVQWFGRYWNATLGSRPPPGVPRITGPGLDPIVMTESPIDWSKVRGR
jgi:hypothetical protein